MMAAWHNMVWPLDNYAEELLQLICELCEAL